MVRRNVDLVALTARITAAYVKTHEVSRTDLPDLIRKVHRSIADLSATPGATTRAASTPVTVVDVRKSVFADHLICLVCGSSKTTLKRHLMTAHQLTPDQYRSKYDLPGGYPMTAPEYSAARANMARASSLGRRR